MSLLPPPPVFFQTTDSLAPGRTPGKHRRTLRRVVKTVGKKSTPSAKRRVTSGSGTGAGFEKGHSGHVSVFLDPSWLFLQNVNYDLAVLLKTTIYKTPSTANSIGH